MENNNGHTLPEPVNIEPGCLGKMYPTGFKKECKALFKLAWPTSLSILFHQLIQPISLMFCGHLGKVELASAAMALSVIYITSVSVGRGLAFGGDTYFSQTYGSANKKQVGIYLQRGLIFGFLCSLPIVGILLNTETLLLLTGQDPVIASMTQKYCLLFTPGVLAYNWLFLLMRYLLCQNNVIPNLLICILSCGVNAVLNYGLVYQAKMGIEGSAIALCITYYFVVILLFAYIWGSGMYKETWDGWSFKCLEDWGPFGYTAASSIFMTFLFWLCTEVGTFLAGLLGEMEISAFSIMFQVEGFAWMVPLGVGSACTARLGQYLGASNPLGAITTMRVALSVQAFISLAMALLTIALQRYIPMAFTSDPEVIDYTAAVMPLCALFLLLEGIGGVGVGIVRGSGRQTLGVVIIFISYYLFALPIGVPLMFLTSMGLAGLWWGYSLGLGLQDICLLIFVARVDWYKESEKAQIRAGTITDDRKITRDDLSAPTNEGLDERTRLLGSSSHSSVNSIFNGENQTHRGITLLKRFFIFLVFASFLVGGYFLSVYVHINTDWYELCLPHNGTFNESMYEYYNDATTNGSDVIPLCNFTHEVKSPFMAYQTLRLF